MIQNIRGRRQRPLCVDAGQGAAPRQPGRELAGAAGGSLLVTDSPRTPRSAGDALQAELRRAKLLLSLGQWDGSIPIAGYSRWRMPSS